MSTRRGGLRPRKGFEADDDDDMMPCSSNSLLPKKDGLKGSKAPPVKRVKREVVEVKQEIDKDDDGSSQEDSGENDGDSSGSAEELVDSDGSEYVPEDEDEDEPPFDADLWEIKQRVMTRFDKPMKSGQPAKITPKHSLSVESDSQQLGQPSARNTQSESQDCDNPEEADVNKLPLDAVILVNRHQLKDGTAREATIVNANYKYCESNRLFCGAMIELNEAARERSKADPDRVQTVYYVHYEDMDRRMDEWIDTVDIAQVVHLKRRHTFDSGSSPPAAIGSTKSRSVSSAPGTSAIVDTRHSRRKHTFQRNLEGGIVNAKCEKTHADNTAVKNIDTIQLGDTVLRCWYFAPYPHEVVPWEKRQLYICETCLMYFPTDDLYSLHLITCIQKEPPGTVIYSTNTFRVYEVVGAEHPLYCESLCLLSKLFLDHKTLYYNVGTFYFYVLCEVDAEENHHLVGHFSKENFSLNNLACILVLPSHQRKGYGKFLIQLSYVLSIREGFTGTPEKPLSDLGKISYRGYWYWLIINVLLNHSIVDDIAVSDVSELSGIAEEDIIITFEPEHMIKLIKGEIILSVSPEILETALTNPLYRAPAILIDPKCITWTRRYTLRRNSDSDDCDSDDSIVMECIDDDIEDVEELAAKYNGCDDVEKFVEKELKADGLLNLDKLDLINNDENRQALDNLANSLNIPHDKFYDPLESFLPHPTQFQPQLSQRHKNALKFCEEIGLNFANTSKIKFNFPSNYESETTDDETEGFDFDADGPPGTVLTVDPDSKEFVRIPKARLKRRRRKKPNCPPSPVLVVKNGILQLPENVDSFIDSDRQKVIARDRSPEAVPVEKFTPPPFPIEPFDPSQYGKVAEELSKPIALPAKLQKAIADARDDDEDGKPIGDKLPSKANMNEVFESVINDPIDPTRIIPKPVYACKTNNFKDEGDDPDEADGADDDDQPGPSTVNDNVDSQLDMDQDSKAAENGVDAANTLSHENLAKNDCSDLLFGKSSEAGNSGDDDDGADSDDSLIIEESTGAE